MSELDKIGKKTKKKDEEILPVFGVENPTIRPLQNFEDKATVGVVLPRMLKTKLVNDVFILREDGKCSHHSKYNISGEVLTIDPMWPSELIEKYINGECDETTFEEVYNLIIKKLKEHVELQEENHYTFIALWIIGTYFFERFEEYPYLWINGPKGSGKSKLMKVLAQIVFYPSYVVGTRAASLFRKASMGCTILYDECEHLWDPKNKEQDAQDKIELINAGNGRGAFIERMDRIDEVSVIRRYNAYCPKAFGSIAQMHHVTSSRAILIPMLKEEGSKYAKKKIKNNDPEWAEIRKKLFALMMGQWSEVNVG